MTTPIALFLYARPDHAARTIGALLANRRAAEAGLVVFCDGPRTPEAAPKVAELRRTAHALLDTQQSFAFVEFVERDENWGLARSIIEGVGAVAERFGRVVVIEDDILTAPDFLDYMLSALDRYAGEPSVFTVSGHTPVAATRAIPEDYPFDAYFNIRFSAWGWGTWADRWRKIDFSVADYAAFKDDLDRQLSFNRGGDDLTQMLCHQVEHNLGTWDVQTAYCMSVHGAVSLFPCRSLVDNIGLDGSGVHCSDDGGQMRTDLSLARPVTRFPTAVETDPRIMEGALSPFARPRPGLVGGGAQAYWAAQRTPADARRLATAAEWIAAGGLDKAWQLLELHLSLVPGDPDALAMMGRIALACDHAAAARPLFLSALSTYADHPGAIAGIAAMTRAG